MKKITLMLVALISAVTLVATINLGNKNKVVMTDTSLLLEDFAGLTQGNMNATGNMGTLATQAMIPTATSIANVYQAGGTARLGTSSAAGTIVFNAIDASAYDSIRIEFDAKAWANKTGEIDVTYGTSTQGRALAQSGTMPFYLQDFEHFTVSFAAASAPTAITITTNRPVTLGDYRALLDNVEVFGVSAGDDEIVIDDPVFTPAAGTYDDSVVVTISCATPGAEIMYAVTAAAADDDDELGDGMGVPSPMPYTGPITLTSSATITAVAFIEDTINFDLFISQEVTAAYIINVTATPDTTDTTDTPDVPEVITLPYMQDFAAASLGTLESTSSSGDVVNDSVLNLIAGIDSVNKVYQAGGMIRLSSGSASGMFITNTIDAGTAAQIEVSFDALGWNNKNVRVALAYGTQADTIVLAPYTGGWPVAVSSFANYSAVFNAEANATLTVTGITGTSNGDRRLFLDNLSIAEYVEDTTQIVVDAPVFTPAAGNYTDSVVVTIAADSTAAIYYTLDGTVPTDSSILYTGAFTLTATTTVKAVAMIDGVYSTVATATYTFPETVATIADFVAAGQGTRIISGTVKAVYQNGQNLYIVDETASILVYGQAGKTYNNGDEITGMMGTYGTYNNAAQIIPVNMPEGVAGTPVDPTVVAMEDLTVADVHRYVRINGVSFTDAASFNTSSRTNGNITDGTATLVMRNNFFVLDGEFEPGTTYDFEGFVAVFNGNVQLYPTALNVSTGVETATEALNIYVAEGNIYVPATVGERVTVFTVNGAVLYDAIATDNMTVVGNMPANQMLVVKVGARAAKVVK